MAELYTTTLKYFWLAIKEFLPTLQKLKGENQGQNVKEQIEDLIEAYNDIARKIERLEQKQYLTDKNKEELYNLKDLVWPLEALSKEESYVLGKYASKGP